MAIQLNEIDNPSDLNVYFRKDRKRYSTSFKEYIELSLKAKDEVYTSGDLYRGLLAKHSDLDVLGSDEDLKTFIDRESVEILKDIKEQRGSIFILENSNPLSFKSTFFTKDALAGFKDIDVRNHHRVFMNLTDCIKESEAFPDLSDINKLYINGDDDPFLLCFKKKGIYHCGLSSDSEYYAFSDAPKSLIKKYDSDHILSKIVGTKELFEVKGTETLYTNGTELEYRTYLSDIASNTRAELITPKLENFVIINNYILAIDELKDKFNIEDDELLNQIKEQCKVDFTTRKAQGFIQSQRTYGTGSRYISAYDDDLQVVKVDKSNLEYQKLVVEWEKERPNRCEFHAEVLDSYFKSDYFIISNDDVYSLDYVRINQDLITRELQTENKFFSNVITDMYHAQKSSVSLKDNTSLNLHSGLQVSDTRVERRKVYQTYESKNDSSKKFIFEVDLKDQDNVSIVNEKYFTEFCKNHRGSKSLSAYKESVKEELKQHTILSFISNSSTLKEEEQQRKEQSQKQELTQDDEQKQKKRSKLRN